MNQILIDKVDILENFIYKIDKEVIRNPFG